MGGATLLAGAVAAAVVAVLLAFLPGDILNGAIGSTPTAAVDGDVQKPPSGPDPEPAPTTTAPASPVIPENHRYPRLKAVKQQLGARVWTPAEFEEHAGEDPEKPLLLCILGEVYDVGPGARFYGPGRGYHGFTGRDRSRAFADAEWHHSESDEASKVEGMAHDELEGIFGWRDFYRGHEAYRFVGFLGGRYYDRSGAPTPELVRVEKLFDASKRAGEVKADLKKRFMACNSRHAQAEPLFELWCDDSYHPRGSLPVHVYYTLPGREEESYCGCVAPRERAAADAESARPEPGRAAFRLVSYPECEAGAQRCKRKKGAQPP